MNIIYIKKGYCNVCHAIGSITVLVFDALLIVYLRNNINKCTYRDCFEYTGLQIAVMIWANVKT